MIKEITLTYRNKSSRVKIHRFCHPITIKCQLQNLSPTEIIYCKIRALIDSETGMVIKLRPHPDYPVFYHIDPTRIKDGGTYQILMRDYTRVNASVLDRNSLHFLERRFDAIKNPDGYLTFSENIEFFNLKKRKYKRQVERQMNTMYEDLDAAEKVHLKKNRIHDMARARIEKGEDAIEEVARIVFSAMSGSQRDRVSFHDFANHWARMYVMMEDVVQKQQQQTRPYSVSGMTPLASLSTSGSNANQGNTLRSRSQMDQGQSPSSILTNTNSLMASSESRDAMETLEARSSGNAPKENMGFRRSSLAQQGSLSHLPTS